MPITYDEAARAYRRALQTLFALDARIHSVRIVPRSDDAYVIQALLDGAPDSLPDGFPREIDGISVEAISAPAIGA